MAFQGGEFDDEDFNDLLEDDLEALEQAALASTQLPPGLQSQHQNSNFTATQTFVGQHRGANISDSAFFEDGEDEVIDANQPAYTSLASPVPGIRLRKADTQRLKQTQPVALRPDHSGLHEDALQGAESAGYAVLAHRPSSQSDPSKRKAGDQEPPLVNGLSDASAYALHTQIRELLLEQEKLRNAVQDANQKLLSKTGEIAIVRSNHDKALRDRDQKMLDLQRDLATAKEQHRVEIDQANRQKEQLATESKFANHDKLIEQTRRRRPVGQASEDVLISKSIGRAGANATTPKKNRQVVQGDGFDTEERSPTKSGERVEQGTPRAAEKKRKRPTESPVKPLPMAASGEILLPDDDFGAFASVPQEHKNLAKDRRYEVLQGFIDRRMHRSGRRTLECLAEYKMPSDDERPLSTLMLDEIARLKSSVADNLPASLCSMVITIWKRCISERYYQPVMHLVDLVASLIQDNLKVSLAVMDDLVELVEKTADVNIIPRFQRFRRAKPEGSEKSLESSDVDVSQCLDLLIEIVTTCRGNSSDVTRFWSLIRFDFISMLLRNSQPLESVTLTCQLLSHSFQAGSFGPIIDPSRGRLGSDRLTQEKSEHHIVDRLTTLLIEQPRRGDNEEPYDAAKISDMRLEILSLLEHFPRHLYSAISFARHDSALGRLVRCMNDEYHESLNHVYGWDERVEVVCHALRLVFHYIYAHAGIVDINEKLRAIPGGSQKYLIVLTRLALTEDSSLYENIVGEDVIDCAHQLLEDYVNPEEGEALMTAFQSGGS